MFPAMDMVKLHSGPPLDTCCGFPDDKHLITAHLKAEQVSGETEALAAPRSAIWVIMWVPGCGGL